MDVQQPIFYSGGVVKKLLRCDVFKNQAAEGGISLEVLSPISDIFNTPVQETRKAFPPNGSALNTIEYTYACKNCEQETGETVVECASREPSVLPGSFASPSAIAHIATQKYVMYSPLYRLEQEFERMGMKLTRQTMSNWLLHASENWLNPIYDVLRQQLHQHQVLHGE